jgi:putative membrane protein
MSAEASVDRPIKLEALKEVAPKRAVAVILAVSVAAFALLIGVIYGHGRVESAPAWVSVLPAVNASLNATSAVFLSLAIVAVKKKDLAKHSRYMLAAMAASALFLVSYLVYHSVHGDTKFPGQGLIRPVYFVILISHIVLSGVALPLIFTSFFFSLSGRFPQHKKVSKFTAPLWLYVSVTGVVVFAMLKAYV